MSDNLSHNRVDPSTGSQLQVAYSFWHKKRVIFNVLVLLAGLIAVILYFDRVKPSDIIGMALWGIVANGLFCIGYSLESYFIISSNGEKPTRLLSQLQFWFLTVGYCILTYFVAVTYFTILPY